MSIFCPGVSPERHREAIGRAGAHIRHSSQDSAWCQGCGPHANVAWRSQEGLCSEGCATDATICLAATGMSCQKKALQSTGWTASVLARRHCRRQASYNHAEPVKEMFLPTSSSSGLTCLHLCLLALTANWARMVPRQMSLAAQCKIPPHIAQYPFEIVSQRGVSHPLALFS